MKSMLLSCAEEGERDGLWEDEMQAISCKYFAISPLPGVNGGNQLQEAAVRVEGGKMLTSDRPFADKEALGGYCLVERIASLRLRLGRRGSIGGTMISHCCAKEGRRARGARPRRRR